MLVFVGVCEKIITLNGFFLGGLGLCFLRRRVFSAVVNISGGFIHQVSEEKAKVGTKSGVVVEWCYGPPI